MRETRGVPAGTDRWDMAAPSIIPALSLLRQPGRAGTVASTEQLVFTEEL